MKYAWIDEQRQAFTLVEMCEVLGVRVSGYREWKSGVSADHSDRGSQYASHAFQDKLTELA